MKGYHQIPMVEEDMMKISFVTNIGICCYTRIPFRLRNQGVDLQEGMNKAFKGLIGTIMEIYVDDIIIK